MGDFKFFRLVGSTPPLENSCGMLGKCGGRNSTDCNRKKSATLFPQTTLTSENYTSSYMSLNMKRHMYVSYTTYNSLKKIK